MRQPQPEAFDATPCPELLLAPVEPGALLPPVPGKSMPVEPPNPIEPGLPPEPSPPGMGAEHVPNLHTPLPGQVTPAQASMQVPALQIVPAAHNTPAHAGSVHLPSAAQVSPVSQPRQLQFDTHSPRSHTRSPGQVTPLQGSTHCPSWHDWP